MWPAAVSPRIVAFVVAAVAVSGASWYVLHLRSALQETESKVQERDAELEKRQQAIEGLKWASTVNGESSNAYQQDLAKLRKGAAKPPSRGVHCYADPVPGPGAPGRPDAAAGAGMPGGAGTRGAGAVPGVPGPDIAASLYALMDQADRFQANLARLQERDAQIAGAPGSQE